MRTLSIRISTPDLPDAQQSAIPEQIAVSHLRVRDVRIRRNRREVGISPGLLLLLPQGRTVNVLLDGVPFEVQAGSVAAFRGSAAKTVLPAGLADDAEEGDGSLWLIELGALINDAFTLQDRLNLPCVFDAAASERIAQLYSLLALRREGIALSPGGTDVSTNIVAALLVQQILAQAAPLGDAGLEPRNNEKVAQLKQFMVQNLCKKVTNTDMADHLGMSLSVFCRWAHRMLDATPARYLRRLRLEKAQELIAQGMDNIEQVAEATGFASRYHLTREFTRYFLISPAKYRRTCRLEPDTDFAARAIDHFSLGQFQMALRTCDEGLQKATTATTRDQLRFHKGRCLQALGHTAEAVAEWKSVDHGSFALQAGIERCRSLFGIGRYDRVLALFHELYPSADELGKRELVHLWMDQAADLQSKRRPGPLGRYLDLRGDLFPAETRSMSRTVHLLRMRGRHEDVLKQCAGMPIACFNALRRAGRYDEAIAYPGIGPEVIALTHLMFGRYEALPESDPDFPDLRAEALEALGRPEEAVSSYPRHSVTAYLRLGQYRELLERIPDHEEARVYALHALGRIRELEAYDASSFGWYLAQILVAPEAILGARGQGAHEYAAYARLSITLRELLDGNRTAAERALAEIDGIRSRDFWWGDHFGIEVLIVSLLRGMLGDRQHLHEDLQAIVSDHKFKDRQAMWHDAAYLTGHISAAGYRKQPNRLRLATRYTFVRAVAHDLKGRRSPARQAYTEYLKTTFDYARIDLCRRFSKWRLQEL